MRGAIPPPQYVFMTWCLVKYRDNFTFTFAEALCFVHDMYGDNVNTDKALSETSVESSSQCADSCDTGSTNFWASLITKFATNYCPNAIRQLYHSANCYWFDCPMLCCQLRLRDPAGTD
jgi:hypothetical protein